MHPALPITLVFVGCCSNVVFLEEITKVFPNCGNLITFSAFLFNCIEGLIFTTKFLTKPTSVPIKYYLVMVTFFFVVQTLNNFTLGFNIAMPLHMIFRAGSLIASLILGVLIMKKKYKMTKYLSVVLISIGIVACTIASANQKEDLASLTGDEAYDYFIWLTGLFLLVLSLFLSARMGIFQEQTYAQYGKHPSEALFYNHFLPLPLFLFIMPDIYNSFKQFTQSDPYEVPVIGVTVPWALLWLLFNTTTQFVCIKSVFTLTTECTSLTVTLVVTLRKFISLVFSIIYFRNPFTMVHWVGAALVFIGTLMFVDVLSRFAWYRRLEALIEKKEEKAKQ
ncbi:UDP-xylose and UDP-N-acetylglucosamine transporter-like [Aplysia californica]|uniref:UDP-xylose and UDP-N-acetylglucosamine transporter-like n=1 Tax=Aplysia californica TaxID=6500 RepID=A0ABM1VQ29_APLCA|nr:UDP-xylose and UDP-N-acetylglucosamine transporter-like [Aplysia californica]XP_035824519.1 UDP-xylose and UDP-N-acetylglucosamine transporter-like [Aplysia californica]XP_035824521.1 UDP-xylose and UDP-N-acetylglucosamine transporter-like [Aplysia californica]